jgi:regulator of sigma E protease
MLYTILNIFLMILGFGLLIFIHELGHFVAAKWAGIRTEAFAVGMGPVAVAWRKGVGFAAGSTHYKVVRATGQAASDLSDEQLVEHGIGETEYSLRWLPIGGFVRMLGQEDANPEAVSDDPRSYNKCPIGKRMIVVSAGVIMNILLAAVLFVAVFMIGVRFDAPVIGMVGPTGPAGIVVAENAEQLGVTSVGLQPGDRVTHIDGQEAKTFADVQISAAMSRRDVPVHFTVERTGVQQPLHFELWPQRDPVQGLRSIGVMPAMSLELPRRDRDGSITQFLRMAGLHQQGVAVGMTMTSVDGQQVETYQEFAQLVMDAHGQPVMTQWSDNGQVVEAEITGRAQFQRLLYPDAGDDTTNRAQDFEEGLFGLAPLVVLTDVSRSSPNHGLLLPGDVVLRIGQMHAPRMREFRETVLNARTSTIEMVVLRDDEQVTVNAQVSRRGVFDDAGMLNVMPGYAWDVPYVAEPMQQIAQYDTDANLQVEPSPIAEAELFAGTKLIAINGEPIENWQTFRKLLREQTTAELDAEQDASLALTIAHPTPGAEHEIIELTLTHEQIASLHALGWSTGLNEFLFQPLQVTRTAGGNPMTALKMGGEETWKMTLLTYLTIDRLFRRTVGVDQLRGPVGIVHVGVTIADKGLLYLIFLLAVISVNLAVINFLPLPIVDGGLFLFLVYEKIKGRPPSIAFQNVATILGLALIVTLFLVVTYNDIMRLL